MSEVALSLDGMDAAGCDGAALLDEARTALARFVILPGEHAYTAVVLWVAATHGITAFEHATRLAIHSAVKRCGKSRLLEVIEALAHNPLSTTNISVPALFRVIDAAGEQPPTLILDEADRLLGDVRKDEDNRDLIAVLNNGFRLGSPTWRCVGPLQTPTPFSNFAMAVVAGIGRKPDTIEDRAVNITMRRRMPGETVAKFKIRRDVPALHDLRDRLAAWITANTAALEKPVADIPEELEDRAEDAWEPLLAVAETAGGDWPDRARKAAVAMAREAAAADGQQSEEIRLLGDVRDVFADMHRVGFLASAVLLAELRKAEDAPWGDADFSARKLALRLAKFDVRPRHNTAKTERGYHLADLDDAFARYLPSEASQPSQHDEPAGQGKDGSADATRPPNRPDGSGTTGGRVRDPAPDGSPDASKTPSVPNETAAQATRRTGRTERTDTPGRCAVDGCAKSPRRSCRTCADHISQENTA